VTVQCRVLILLAGLVGSATPFSHGRIQLHHNGVAASTATIIRSNTPQPFLPSSPWRGGGAVASPMTRRYESVDDGSDTGAPSQDETTESTTTTTTTTTTTETRALYTQIDWAALAKYSVGLATQMALIYSTFTVLDKVIAMAQRKWAFQIPTAIHFVFLYAFNLRTSFFSILPNQKPTQEDNWAYEKRKVPSWTPPGIVFAIMWPLVVFGLRAATGAMVVAQSAGRYATTPIMTLMLHLGVANLWNTVNNVERRLGFSVILLYLLWLTKVATIVQLYRVSPLAGKLLAITMTWLTAAAALETNTWLINPDALSGKLEPLIPRKHPKWKTVFRWEQQQPKEDEEAST